MADQSSSGGRRSLRLAVGLAVVAVVGGLVGSRWPSLDGAHLTHMPESVSRLAPGTPIGEAKVVQVVGAGGQSARVDLSTPTGRTVSVDVLLEPLHQAPPTVQTPSLALYLVPPAAGVSAEEAGALVRELAAMLTQAAPVPADAGPERASGEPHVVPPGQEALLAEMLGKGAELPGGCRWEEAAVEWSKVTSRYTCGTQTYVLTLFHPSSPHAASAVMTTGAFAMSGKLPPELVEALAGRIRQREAAFHWQVVRASTAPFEPSFLLAAGGALAAALVAIAVRRSKPPG